MKYIVQTSNLTKIFQGKAVVWNVNMNIKEGEIYGFLGPNGAGKTTIMKMLTKLIKPSEGSIVMFGEQLNSKNNEVLRNIGSIIEYPFFYDKLTAEENLEIHCEYFDNKNTYSIAEVLEMVNLNNTGDKKVKDFSLGMKQRLGIARAIITKPKLLILDEPINGLDPIGIREMRDLFKRLSRECGITLLISSHILGEIEQIADTIGVISNGHLIKEVSMKQVKSQMSDYIELVVDDVTETVRLLQEQQLISNVDVTEDGKIHLFDAKLSVSEISKNLIMNGIKVEEIRKHSQSLEDYFLSILNGGNYNE